MCVCVQLEFTPVAELHHSLFQAGVLGTELRDAHRRVRADAAHLPQQRHLSERGGKLLLLLRAQRVRRLHHRSVRAHTHAHTHAHTRTHTRTHTHMLHTHTHTSPLLPQWRSTHAHSHTHTHTHNTLTHTHTPYTHTHTHTHFHPYAFDKTANTSSEFSPQTEPYTLAIAVQHVEFVMVYFRSVL